MARIKRDPNDWKVGGIHKRDFQHSHDEPEVPKKNPSRSTKKDTRTWCRGKVGREHVVKDKTPPRMPDFSCCSPKKQKHYAWNHCYEIKCINCGMGSWRLPDEAKAQVEPRLKLMLEAEKKWCGDGHLFDWASNMIGPPKAFESNPQYRLSWRDDPHYAWSSQHWEHQFCVMCGKQGKTRYRNP